MSRGKILIVDDEEHVLEVIRKRLTFNGYEVITATDGEMGLQKVLDDLPDLVILDVLMPGLDGCQVMERIRKNKDAIKNVPIIIMSGVSDMEGRFNGYDIHSFILKPFTTEELLEQVQSILD